MMDHDVWPMCDDEWSWLLTLDLFGYLSGMVWAWLSDWSGSVLVSLGMVGGESLGFVFRHGVAWCYVGMVWGWF